MGLVVMDEGGEISKEDLRIDDSAWNAFKGFLEKMSPYIKEVKKEYDIEELPPVMTDEKFKPGSWIGYYPAGEGIQVVPKKISRDEYQRMKEEIIGWLGILGGPFNESIRPFFPSEILHMESRYTSYSHVLIDSTEILFAHQIPREVKPRVRVGPELRGGPIWKKILELKFKDPTLLASRQVKFTFRTLPNLLLTLFHANLARGLKKLSESTPFYEQELRSRRGYHMEFISSGLPVDLLYESLETNFLDPETLEKTRRISSLEMQDIVDLWEAFTGWKALQLDIGKRFDAAIKPMSKVYELWCLKVLCEILEVKPKPLERFPATFSFGDEGMLYYNKVPKQKSKILGQIPVGPGKPDYTIENKGEIVCVADAKYRESWNIGLEDYQRFLSYLLDFVCPHKGKLTGFLFHLSMEKEIKEYSRENCQVFLVPLRPDFVEDVKSKLQEHFQELLG